MSTAAATSSATASAAPSPSPVGMPPSSDAYKQEAIYRVGKLIRYFSKHTSVTPVSNPQLAVAPGVNVLRLDKLAGQSVDGSTLVQLFDSLSDGVFHWRLTGDYVALLWTFHPTGSCHEATRMLSHIITRLGGVSPAVQSISRDPTLGSADFNFCVPTEVNWDLRDDLFAQIMSARGKSDDFVYDMRAGGRIVITWLAGDSAVAEKPPASETYFLFGGATEPSTTPKRPTEQDASMPDAKMPRSATDNGNGVVVTAACVEPPKLPPMLRTVSQRFGALPVTNK